MRLPATPRALAVACDGGRDDPLRLRYELEARELVIQEAQGASPKLCGYLTEEVREGKPRPERACLLLPGAAGWKHPPTRRLADRIAVFCSCLVLIPDLLRTGDPWPSEQPQVGDAFASWRSSYPPNRIASDVRTSTIFLRADHRVAPVALLGTALGGGHVLDELDSPNTYVGAAVLCPRALPRFTSSCAPLLVIFDCGAEQDAQALAANAELSLFLQKQKAAEQAESILEFEAEVDDDPKAPAQRTSASGIDAGSPQRQEVPIPSR